MSELSSGSSAPSGTQPEASLEVVGFEPQRTVATDLVREFLATGLVSGILLDGSFARSEARPDSDLDFYLLLRDDDQQLPYPHRFERSGIQVDLAQHDRPTIIRRIAEKPMRVYRHLFGQILVDRDGGLDEVERFARSFMADFRTPPDVVSSLVPTLKGLRGKMLAAAGSSDETLIGWSATWSSWTIAEAVFAANDRPTPPGSLLFRMLSQLSKPADLGSCLASWFKGGAVARHEAGLRLLDFALDDLSTRL